MYRASQHKAKHEDNDDIVLAIPLGKAHLPYVLVPCVFGTVHRVLSANALIESAFALFQAHASTPNRAL